MSRKDKWEFKKVVFNCHKERVSLLNLLSQYGKNGWQLAGYFQLPILSGQSEILFKRLKGEEKKAWQYMLKIFNRSGKETLKEFLDRNNKNGWEMVNSLCVNVFLGKFEIIFKRLKE